MSPFGMADRRLLPPLPAPPPILSSAKASRAAFRARVLGPLTPCDDLRWGCQKMFEYNTETKAASADRISPERRKRKMDSYSSKKDDEDNVEEVRREITNAHYQFVVDKSIQEVSETAPVKKVHKDECPPTTISSSEEARSDPSPLPRSSKPCNLRKRRSTCGLPTAQQQHPQSPLEAPAENHLGAPWASKDSRTETNKATLQLTLTKEEIYQDFILMTGAPPPRKLKKRPAKVHRYMQALYPEPSALCITADLYKVPEEKGQRR